MKKKKIVAMLLAAAMTATSFMSAGGFFGLTKAQADSTTFSILNKSDLKAVSSIELSADDSTEKTFSWVVTDSSIKENTATDSAKALLAVVNAAKIETSGSFAVGQTSAYYPFAVGDVTSGTSLDSASNTYNLEPKITAERPGKGTIKYVNGEGTILKTINVTVKTNDATITGASIEHNGTANRVSASDIKYAYQNKTEIDRGYVSGGTLDYTWIKVGVASSASQVKTAYDNRNTDKAVVSTGTAMSYSLSRDDSDAYFALVVSSSALNPSGTDYFIGDASVKGIYIVTAGPFSYVNSTTKTPSTTPSTTPAETKPAETKPAENTETKPDGTKETVTTTDNPDGSKTTTTTDVNPDGSTKETSVTTNADGSTIETVKETKADGSTSETVTTKNTDGSSTETVKATNADGSTVESTKTTAADGSSVGKSTTTYTKGSVKTKVEESTVAANGDSTVVVTTENTDGTVGIVNESKDSAGETTVTLAVAKNSSNATVSDIDTTAKAVTIPATVTANGKTYKVTKLGANALKGNKTATKVVVGKNIKNIGKQAFQNAKKLKTLNIKGNVTTIGKNSFKGIKSNATIKIKATAKQYKAMVKKIKNKGGAPKKVTFKRVK